MLDVVQVFSCSANSSVWHILPVGLANRTVLFESKDPVIDDPSSKCAVHVNP